MEKYTIAQLVATPAAEGAKKMMKGDTWEVVVAKASDVELWCFLWSVCRNKRSSRAHYDGTVMGWNDILIQVPSCI